jgi:hypothetical protein
VVPNVQPSRRLAHVILAIGIVSDVLVSLLYHAFVNGLRPPNVLVFSLLTSILLGISGTFIGSVMWARRASSEAVIAAVFSIILLMLLYGNRVQIGMDDPKIMVIPFALVVVLLLLIGHVFGKVRQN